MADYKLIPIAEINVPERLRAVEDDHARAIQASIAERGLLNPITVRATPAAKGGKYTLVAGAHRLRAVSLNGSSEIEAIVVVADKEEAVLIEVEENLFRNDLSALDRAIFVQTHREVWERKYGKIEPGRGNGAKLAQFLEGKPDAAFSDHVAEKLGLSKRAVYRSLSIAKNLHPDLRQSLRGTALAENQSTLLKLSKIEPANQRKAAIAFRETNDLKQTLQLIGQQPAPKKVDPQEEIFARLVGTWERASAATKARFLKHVDVADGEAA
ncbi:ParB/RepB/Spo0J family partition protein [Nitratireductor aquimarinus]|uniref:ParB/RepB/Spo0J family partition protein n=1 Tax=Nitratireductor aquimarinus TaxID=889300 RepID=UPI001A8C23CC|nr:ParB/RepB/Spo0J family partition protein [Nitratireductor aquimarinus]MBN8243277.1 ParB/RepB/Spo0J family partition protein [Nitratireductor aquimarinus]MBY6131178.1 ParB/RepB/Spo0J family partition protein [Nitratireductor aquimarinus]MCA1302066.1 ParB/RepB/Spo0J family partition protein [Nitratireductor aquimarinus]